ALPGYLSSWTTSIKRKSRLPVCVGFGISSARQAREVSRTADGVIVGSAIIDRISGASTKIQIIKETGHFIKQLREGLDHE
ncbi:MAG: tryptophan synthase subunit alpha, partial [Candidatus Zixiibacteriota bacterium]